MRWTACIAAMLMLASGALAEPDLVRIGESSLQVEWGGQTELLLVMKQGCRIEGRVLSGPLELASASSGCDSSEPVLVNDEVEMGGAARFLLCAAGKHPGAGDHPAQLLFVAGDDKGRPTSEPFLFVQATVKAPSAALETDHVGKHRVELVRRWPGRSADGCARVPLVETGGKVALEGLVVTALTAHRDGAPTLPVRARVLCADSTQPTPGLPSCTETQSVCSEGLLPPEGWAPTDRSGSLGLHFSGFERVGDVEVDVLLEADTLATPVLLPIQVLVRDPWVLPFLVILLGVLAAFLVSRMIKRHEAAKDLSDALSELERTLPETDETQKLQGRVNWLGVRNWTPIGRKEGVAEEIEALSREVTGELTKSQKLDAATQESLAMCVQSLRSAEQELSRTRLWAGSELLLAACSIALASLLGLQAIYFGKAFGTSKDYLDAALWGFGTQAGLDAFGSLINKVKTFF